MPLQIPVVLRHLADGMFVAEPLGMSEISVLAATETQALALIEEKAREVLERGEMKDLVRLHRRAMGAGASLEKFSLTLNPPKRDIVWTEAVHLSVPFVQWAEPDGLLHGFVPGLDLEVMAPDQKKLAAMLEDHARLLLLQRRKRIDLLALAQTERVVSLSLHVLEIVAKIKSPKQWAEEERKNLKAPSVLAKIATKLNALALSPAHEVEEAVQQLAEVLGAELPQSVLLVGPAGVGKTAIFHELVRRRKEWGFAETPFWMTSGARIMAGQTGFGMWQERCRELSREAAQTKAIVHLGNLGELLEVGKIGRGDESVGSFLRPALARGEWLAVAEITPEQLVAVERMDPHLPTVFRRIDVPEPKPDAVLKILTAAWNEAPGKAPATPPHEALRWLHRLHQRYATYSANPGRPLRFLGNLLKDRAPDKTLLPKMVTQAFGRETGLPEILLDDEMPLVMDETRAWFHQRVIGQPLAVEKVADLLATVKAQLARPRKPLASLLFIGPTGTGKTELAKSLAEFLFGDVSRLTRFDMSEFSNPLAVQRLVGGPYVGTPEGLLTAKVREQPFGVLLLDEFEKADPSFFDLLLQILGDGRLTDASGRVADFCNAVIVMTSNLGAVGFQRGPAGFPSDGSRPLDAAEHFTDAVRKFLRPEIYNRLDAIVPFDPLPEAIIRAIAQKQIDLVKTRDGFRNRSMELSIAPEVVGQLAKAGFDVRYGARPLKRAIEREFLTPLAEALNSHSAAQPLVVNVLCQDGKIKIEAKSRPVKKWDAVEPPAALAASERRTAVRLRRCEVITAMENELALLPTLERRMARVKWSSTEDQNQLARMREIKLFLERLDLHVDSTKAMEIDYAAEMHASGGLAQSPDTTLLEKLQRERQELRREAMRLSCKDADSATLALWSEDHGRILSLASAYFECIKELKGKITHFDCFTAAAKKNGERAAPAREAVKDTERFFKEPPKHLLGVVFRAKGELFQPMFASEDGLVTFVADDAMHLVLQETTQAPFPDYKPPQGIERKGAIHPKVAKVVRSWDSKASQLRDHVLGVRDWHRQPLAKMLLPVFKDTLSHRIANIEGPAPDIDDLHEIPF